MTGAREEVLGRIRGALGPGAVVPEIPRDYHVAGSGAAAGSEAVVARFCERAGDYKATVRRIAAADVEDAVVEACREQGARRLAVPTGAPHRVAGLELLIDDPPISARGLDQVDGVLTGCALAIAETGTVVLDGGEQSGRRALTLVPDFHVCLVEAARIHASVPDAIAALAPAAAEGRPLTFVSGPARRRTSSSSAWRASTGRGRWSSWCSSDPAGGARGAAPARPARRARARGRARSDRPRLRPRAEGERPRAALDRARDADDHQPRRDPADPGLDPALGQRRVRLRRPPAGHDRQRGGRGRRPARGALHGGAARR